MRLDRTVDVHALDVLRAAVEDVEQLLEHKQKTAPEECRWPSGQVPYCLVIMLPTGDGRSFDVFMGSNAIHLVPSMLGVAQAKAMSDEPIISERVI